MVRKRGQVNTKLGKLPFAGKYSMKNIPIPRSSEYMKKLIGQMEKVVRNMRWKALFFLKDDEKYKKTVEDIECYGKEEKYGFKSVKKPYPINELENFEKDIYDIAKQIEFRENFKLGEFQKEMKKDLSEMSKLNEVIVAADKSSNFYTCDVPEYKILRNQNVTAEYKKSTLEAVNENDKKSAEMAIKLKLDNKMQKHSNKECFVTLKDHKDNFIGRPQCRLISPAKNELGRVVKIKLEEINREIRYTTGVNQWQSTQKAINWFKDIKDPQSHSFLKFDIVSFYPSIKPKLLENAIRFARTVKGIIISKVDEDMILHCRRSFLFCEGQPWTKTGSENFDVPMGSYDGAEVCELVGLYILHKLTSGKNPIFEKADCGIYRDDGLAIIKLKEGGRTMERTIKPNLNKIFNSEDLKITIEPATQVTSYLDIVFNLEKHVHEPYRKSNDHPTYLNVDSDHPKHIIKHIPKMIGQRLSSLSSTEEIFDAHKGPYEEALAKSGYKKVDPKKKLGKSEYAYELKYQKPEKSRRKRKSRNIIYFNPPFSKSVKTNVVKLFLNLIDKHFPKGSKLHKCFNRNTVKATYCTLPNMMDKIGSHNAKILSKDKEEKVVEIDKKTGKPKTCCRNQANCPLKPDRCNQTNVVYQIDVHADNKVMKYYGSTVDFKNRYSKHKSSFNKRPQGHTTVSSYIWNLRDKNIDYEIKWSIKARGHVFSSGGRACDLCLTEKLVILTADQNSMLNKRDELLETCRHRRKHLLVSLTKKEEPPDTTIK